jgi:hypothetical protein
MAPAQLKPEQKSGILPCRSHRKFDLACSVAPTLASPCPEACFYLLAVMRPNIGRIYTNRGRKGWYEKPLAVFRPPVELCHALQQSPVASELRTVRKSRE